MENSGDHQETVVPPVEGVAGGGTAYGWSDTGVNDPRPLRGAIDPTKVSSLELLNVWCMPNSANVGPQDMPRELEPLEMEEKALRSLYAQVFWGGSGIAGTVQVQCTDLCLPCGARLVVGQSLTLRRVVPVLGVSDALVPLDMPRNYSNLVSIDVPSEQPPGQYEGEIIIFATKAEAESTSQSLSKVEKHQLYRELRDCLDAVEPLEGKPLEEVVERVKSATSSLRRVLLSPSFSDFFSDNGPIDIMEEDAISSLSIRLKISLTVWDFVLPATPSVPAVIGEWWTYVCLGPGDPHSNWHLGMRGTQHRAVMWRVWKEGGTCFLYWGANCYEKATVPSAEIKFRRGLPPGDGVLFYPGQVFSSSQQPVASLRLERLLSGLQDIEYLKLYASRFGRDEGLNLLEKTGMYLGPESYTSEHTPIDVMRGEVYRTRRS